MIDFEQARQIALDHIGSEQALFEESILEKPYGWYFCAISKACLASGDIRDMFFGGGGFIVERETGRICQFGSAYPLETNLTNYEKGFKYESYDLTILSIRNWLRTVELIKGLDMTYVVPEYEHGVEWKIPRCYGRIQLLALLKTLPCTFSNQGFTYKVEIFDQIDRTGCCVYKLRKHQESRL